MTDLTVADIQAAQKRLANVVQETPLLASKTFSTLAGTPLWLKMETMQKTGSFKIRGAFNMIAQLSSEDRRAGIIAASAGNHAQGVAFAAQAERTPCTIVMSEGASLAKVAATQSYGASVLLKGDTYDDAYREAKALQDEHGYTFVHAFDHPHIVAGQGTIGLEILTQLPNVDTIVVPMGGGGLATGIAIAVKSLKPSVRVIGVEAAAVACFHHALRLGRPETIETKTTIADGIAVRRPGDLTFHLAQRYIDEVVTVDEEDIVKSMVLLMERGKIIAEGAAAAAFAAAIYRKIPSGSNLGNTVVVLSGGNVDVHLLSQIIEHGLVSAGRYVRLTVRLVDKPGSLRNLLEVIAHCRANVISILHHRLGHRISLGETDVEIDLETRDDAHIETLLQALVDHGYQPLYRDSPP